MPFEFHVEMPEGTPPYKLTRLLAKGKSNNKIAKSDKANAGYLTYSLSLAPATVSGFNLCTSSSHGCRSGCIFTSGLARVWPEAISQPRIAKSRMLRMHKVEFIKRLTTELGWARRKAKRLGLKLAVRLNVFSDVMWEREVPQLFTMFEDVTFYDYTKHAKRMLRYLNGGLPPNYQLTFSRSENNEVECLDILSRGGNVAIPFHIKRSKSLPARFAGHEVINGDQTDLRFLDPQGGYVVGLHVKGEAKKDFTSNFVVSIGDRRVVA